MRKIGFSQKTSWEKGVVEKQPKEKIWFSKGLKDLENNLFTILVLEETVNNLQFYQILELPFINVRNMIWTLQSKCAVFSVLKQTSSQCYPKSLRKKVCFFVHFKRKSDYFWPPKSPAKIKILSPIRSSLLPKSLPKLVALPTANQLLFAVLTYYIPTRQVPLTLPEPRLA